MKKGLQILLLSFIVFLASLTLLAWKYSGVNLLGMDGVISQKITKLSPMPAGVGKISEEELPEHFEYYYEQLNEQERQWYQELYGVIKTHGNGTRVSMMEMDTMERLLQYIILDNPELFYIENLETETFTVGGINALMTVSVIENMEREKQKEAGQQIKEFRNTFMNRIDKGMSDGKKAELAFTYVVEELEYVEDSDYNQSLYSAALGETVCMGYTAAYKYLCDQMEIPCISVIGTMAGSGHAWNMVYLDHIWYQVDCTQGDDLVTYPPKIDYKWFKIGSREMQKTHTLQEPDMLPVCQ